MKTFALSLLLSGLWNSPIAAAQDKPAAALAMLDKGLACAEPKGWLDDSSQWKER